MTPLTKEEIDAYEAYMHLACDVPLQVSIHRLFYTARLGAALTLQLARFAAAIERLEEENACLKTQLLSPLDEAQAQLAKVMQELQQALDSPGKEAR